jgi:hypothetical protein
MSDAAPSGPEIDEAASEAHWFRIARRTLAGLLVLMVLVSALAGWFLVYEPHVLAGGKVIYVDRPMEITDVRVLFALVLALLLLWPDLSEIGVPGLLSIKRRLVAAESKADLLEIQLETLNATASASASTTTNVLFVGPEELQQLVADLPAKAEALAEPARAVGSAHPPVVQVDEEAASLASQLLALWERLDDQILITQGRAATLLRAMPDEFKTKRQRFLALFNDEISTVRAARNNIAHARQLSGTELRSMLDIASQLLSIWKRSLEDND